MMSTTSASRQRLPGIAALLLVSVTALSDTSEISRRDGLTIPVSPYPNWSYAGCYVDTVQTRMLPFNFYTGRPITNANCVSFCSNHGYYVAGTEYSGECWCGSSIIPGDTLAPDADCSMPCKGDSTEACGGPNRLTVYETASTFVDPGIMGFHSLGCWTLQPACGSSPQYWKIVQAYTSCIIGLFQ
ncbi:WSC-domain-containing protein [Lophiostoma macrostomum CBS 122681]|uniref:WSC-domain-containing protein n=1 Tax=Lophiostoma macrostomum CBS 122681 TaxID=1314788 RepID=A0A6A6T5R9_9PLEO|nr:WSC-domain-containing protein [Lophiostoma macrostomum CBS 122681]